MWELLKQEGDLRTYKNTVTGSESQTKVILTDNRGNKWWSFVDLFTIPLLREIAAKKVTELYGAGISNQDLKDYVAKQKAILKTTDPEKYERLFSELLQMEAAIETVGDPTKQLLSLATVYVLSDTEKPDGFDQNDAFKKMEVWQHDPEAMVFFLNWLTDTINGYLSASGSIGEIVSAVKSLGDQKNKPSTNASKK